MVRFDNEGELGLDLANDEVLERELEELRAQERDARQEVKAFQCRSDDPNSRIL